jgi:hypothetical protein
MWEWGVLNQWVGRCNIRPHKTIPPLIPIKASDELRCLEDLMGGPDEASGLGPGSTSYGTRESHRIGSVLVWSAHPAPVHICGGRPGRCVNIILSAVPASLSSALTTIEQVLSLGQFSEKISDASSIRT